MLIELLLMGFMYKGKRLHVLIPGVGLVALIGFFAMIREQVAILDRQFLRSMIPHHAGAILMCEQAPIRDARSGSCVAGLLPVSSGDRADAGDASAEFEMNVLSSTRGD